MESQEPSWQSRRASRLRGLRLDARRAVGEQAEPAERLRVGVGVRFPRADALDAMVHRADAGGQEQPLRRVHGDGGIEDDRRRDDARMAEQLLHPGPLVRDAGDGAELAGGQGRRHGDLPHRRRLAGRRADRAVGPLHRAQGIQRLRRADAVRQAELHRLGRVGDRAAADGHDQVGPGRAGHLRRLDDRPAGRMGRHAVEHRRAPGSQRGADPLDLPRFPVQRAAAHQEHALRSGAPDQIGDRLGRRRPEHHLVHPAEHDAAARRHGASSRGSWSRRV